MSYFPEAIIFNILSWLPVVPLVRFRCVSKSWYSQIKSPTFIQTHLSNAKINSKSLVFQARYELFIAENYESRNEVTTLNIPNCELPDYVNIVGCRDGLICFESCNSFTRKYAIHLWNPSTREYLELPYVPIKYESFNDKHMFFFDPFIKAYKIVKYRVYYDIDTNEVERDVNEDKDGETERFSDTHEAYVYTVGTSLSWRQIPVSVESIDEIIRSINTSLNEVLNGIIHGTGYDVIGNEVIVGFDMKKEVFNVLQIPNANYNQWHHKNVIVVGENICLFLSFIDYAEVWTMKEYGNPLSWKKQFTYMLLTREKLSIEHVVFITNNGWILYLHNGYGVVYLKPENFEFCQLQIDSVPFCYFPSAYVGSLVSPMIGE